MKINYAIQKAIEGGYFPFKEGKIIEHKKGNWWHVWESTDENGDPCELKRPLCWDSLDFFNYLILDPLFWEALGKAMGWRSQTCAKCNGYFFGEKFMRQNLKKNVKGNPYSCHNGYDFIPESLFHWHRMIDHLADGGNLESFFEPM